ncbi:diguanylate phosphodiesterase [Rhodovulum sp. PH10]|uniref:EAL domain-containing protein n=1 Tax=Rhodovulum sp. PH10 TaxID=1187851 RepID=UPI00027C1E8B|nr:EAL domain-containing protein [Rhodovulum sp. PH10]EJW10416.1 diguanylate phosphodiesterase [Rhodovulum sp. PH10]
MARLGAVFVALCMVLIAGSLGALLYFYLGTSGAESAIVALAAFTGMAIYNATATRLGDRDDARTRIDDLSRGTADLARQVIELGRRVQGMESRFDGVLDRAGEATRPLSDEIGELGTLVTHLAETVAAHDAALRNAGTVAGFSSGAASGEEAPGELAPDEAAPDESAPGEPAPSPPVPHAVSAPQLVATVTAAAAAPVFSPLRAVEPAAVPVWAEPVDRLRPDEVPSGIFAGLTEEEATEMVREAIEADRIDLHLQPIVRLPQRKVRFYEAVARLRSRAGDTIMPADFLPLAEAAGLLARLDQAVMVRGVQVVRRLIGKSREIGLFCNVSTATLLDPVVFPQFVEFAEANRALAPSFVFELRQSTYRTLGPIENESLAALADRGFRFSLDHVGDLLFEPRDLASRGFRFVKVPAALLLDRGASAAADIHPADLAGLFGRFGIELIAERIEAESTVVDLLDYEVKYGQGFLFSPPRPVRPEVLQGFERSGFERAGFERSGFERSGFERGVDFSSGAEPRGVPSALAAMALAAGRRAVAASEPAGVAPPEAAVPIARPAAVLGVTPPGMSRPNSGPVPVSGPGPGPGPLPGLRPGAPAEARTAAPPVRPPEPRLAERRGPDGRAPEVRPGERPQGEPRRRPSLHAGTVLAQIARGMLARK